MFLHIRIYIRMYTCRTLYTHGRCKRGTGWTCPPILKSRGTSYVLVPPPYFYHKMYFDWLAPPTLKIVPAPLYI